MELYEILGLPKTATADEIKHAYRQAAWQWHPDRNPGNSEALKKFKNATEAFEVLSDPVKKAEYDLKGYVGRRPANRPSKSKTKPAPKPEKKKEEEGMRWDWADKPSPEELQAIQCTFFEDGKTGRSILMHAYLDKQTLQEGGTQTIKIKRKEWCKACMGEGVFGNRCQTCHGSGRLYRYGAGVREQSTAPICYTCQGSGTLDKKCARCSGSGNDQWVVKYVRFYIPPNSLSGQQIRVVGEGEEAPRKPPGELRIVLLEKENAG